MRLALLVGWLAFTQLLAAAQAAGGWTKSSAPFDTVAITRNGGTFWICGRDAAIASSSDGGAHWDVRYREARASTLLSLRWANEKLGFAAGTGGFLLLSADGGASWQRVPTAFSDPILDVSFADPQHGIVLTTTSVLYTNDAGKNWRSVLPLKSPELARFKFVLELAALDSDHAAVLVKEGPAQYYDGRLVTTNDAGSTWKTSEIEHTTLNNLLVVANEYWLVGTEVIDREHRGGHAVPVTFHSRDGLSWKRGPKPLIDTNYACRPEGCLMRNGAWFDTFVEYGKIHTFPAIPGLTTRWSATDDRICALIPDLECANAAIAARPPEASMPTPQLAASELRPNGTSVAGQCIRCDYPHILVSDDFKGPAIVKLALLAQPDGTVSSVEVLHTPNAEIGAKLALAARAWIFYPDPVRGAAGLTKRTATLAVNVIKPD